MSGWTKPADLAPGDRIRRGRGKTAVVDFVTPADRSAAVFCRTDDGDPEVIYVGLDDAVRLVEHPD